MVPHSLAPNTTSAASNASSTSKLRGLPIVATVALFFRFSPIQCDRQAER